MNFKNTTILVLSPHPDDGILGCGGTIAKAIEEGADVHYVTFSWAEQGFAKDEPKKSLDALGIKNNKTLNYRVRNFSYVRQEILEDIIQLREKLNPDIIFIPSSFDNHQDHVVINREARRAFKKHALLGYEESWNNFTFEGRCFVELSEKHIDKKLASAKVYKTQQGKIYMDTALIKSRARDRASYIRKANAEAFEIIRWVI
jgi:LmbE family N-acetylglucosaminyl deacetylase